MIRLKNKKLIKVTAFWHKIKVLFKFNVTIKHVLSIITITKNHYKSSSQM